jgi:hypothetical protein
MEWMLARFLVIKSYFALQRDTTSSPEFVNARDHGADLFASNDAVTRTREGSNHEVFFNDGMYCSPIRISLRPEIGSSRLDSPSAHRFRSLRTAGT